MDRSAIFRCSWRAADAEAPTVICGQGVAPAKATITHYRAEEGAGLRHARDRGAGSLRCLNAAAMRLWHDTAALVLEPAIHYAEEGHPISLNSDVTSLPGPEVRCRPSVAVWGKRTWLRWSHRVHWSNGQCPESLPNDVGRSACYPRSRPQSSGARGRLMAPPSMPGK